ncbi:MAG: rRNA pseudouridine synthase [Holosporales bacterium]|nr:rRNA pseudouridine synthase [Holosporales bacterium]
MSLGKDPSNSTLNPPANRIAKVIARAGVCSRRAAEKLIFQGRVSVDGIPITTPAMIVTPTQCVYVDGKLLPILNTPRLWLFHKPAGVITTHYDPQRRKTVFDIVTQYALPHVISVGRLDVMSEGLLLLTNHGGIARSLEHPSAGWARCYRVRVFGSVTQEALDRLQQGITIKGITYTPLKATLNKTQGSNAWVTMTLHEGKNREIRKIAEHFGWKVNRLIRVAYGPFQLGPLPVGKIQEIPQKVLHEHLGTVFH